MLANFFKFEEQKHGADLLDKVIISSASDTAVRAFVRGSQACKVSLSADGIASAACTADCTCSAGRKGALCKHIWAVLLKLEGYDFLASKKEIVKVGPPPNPIREMANLRQAAYRKERYQKNKERSKQLKGDPAPAANYPEPVVEARAFFNENGFPFQNFDLDELLNAKKILMRVFHPDKGGSHEETVKLNQNFDILSDYLKE
jgi:SWIM zinc finger